MTRILFRANVEPKKVVNSKVVTTVCDKKTFQAKFLFRSVVGDLIFLVPRAFTGFFAPLVDADSFALVLFHSIATTIACLSHLASYLLAGSRLKIGSHWHPSHSLSVDIALISQ